MKTYEKINVYMSESAGKFVKNNIIVYKIHIAYEMLCFSYLISI